MTRRIPVITTRPDLRFPCRNCGHGEFVVLERGARDSSGTQLEVDVERCERCGKARHS